MDRTNLAERCRDLADELDTFATRLEPRETDALVPQPWEIVAAGRRAATLLADLRRVAFEVRALELAQEAERAAYGA